MSISFIESICDKCGAKQRISCNTWGYGSPIVICGSCGAEYLERQFTEPALEGTVPVTENSAVQKKGFAVCLAMAVVGGLLYKFFTVGRIKLLLIAVFGVLGMIYFGYLMIRNKTGAAARENQKYLDESRQRLSDRNYVEKLRAYGYNIPDGILSQTNPE